MPQANLQFLVIGAMKSGTTSLHYHLQRHPALALPRSKEAPFFSRDAYYRRGMDWYLREFFPKARPDQRLGTVSPQYMAFPGVATRIREHCPDVRLIAILRDPVQRAQSHYRMAVRSFGERRAFRDAVAEQLEAGDLAAARAQPTQINSYVAWGEYGRILGDYLRHFPCEQLLVVFTSELADAPRRVLTRLFGFIGVADMEIEGLDRRRHVSTRRGVARRLLAGSVFHQGLRRIGKRLLTEEQKSRIRIWSIMNRDSGVTADASLPDDLQRRLWRHYSDDAESLQALLHQRVPWHAALEEEPLRECGHRAGAAQR